MDAIFAARVSPVAALAYCDRNSAVVPPALPDNEEMTVKPWSVYPVELCAGSLFHAGRIDLNAVTSGYSDPGFAIARVLCFYARTTGTSIEFSARRTAPTNCAS